MVRSQTSDVCSALRLISLLFYGRILWYSTGNQLMMTGKEAADGFGAGEVAEWESVALLSF